MIMEQMIMGDIIRGVVITEVTILMEENQLLLLSIEVDIENFHLRLHHNHRISLSNSNHDDMA